MMVSASSSVSFTSTFHSTYRGPFVPPVHVTHYVPCCCHRLICLRVSRSPSLYHSHCHRARRVCIPRRSARYSLRSQRTSLTTRGQNIPNKRRPPLPRIQHASHPPIHLWGIYDMAPIKLDCSFRFYFQSLFDWYLL
jgi:hypothetical protein